MTGFEPATSASTEQRSNRLSYTYHAANSIASRRAGVNNCGQLLRDADHLPADVAQPHAVRAVAAGCNDALGQRLGDFFDAVLARFVAARAIGWRFTARLGFEVLRGAQHVIGIGFEPRRTLSGG